jgi:hypothetical protein
MVEAEAAFKADLEKLLKNEGHMPEDKFLVMSRKGKRLGVAFVSTPRGEGGAGFLTFKTQMSGSKSNSPPLSSAAAEQRDEIAKWVLRSARCVAVRAFAAACHVVAHGAKMQRLRLCDMLCVQEPTSAKMR